MKEKQKKNLRETFVSKTWKEQLQDEIANIAEHTDEIEVVIELLHIVEMLIDK